MWQLFFCLAFFSSTVEGVKIEWTIETNDEGTKYQWAYGCSFEEEISDQNTIGIQDSNSTNDCAIICLSTNNCTHFNFFYYEEYCVLYNSTAIENHINDVDAKNACGMIPSRNNQNQKQNSINWQQMNDYTWADECEFSEEEENTLANEYVSSVDECATECIVYKSCTHFIFSAGSGLCVFLSKPVIPEENARYSSYLACGYLKNPVIPDFQWNKIDDFVQGTNCSFPFTNSISIDKDVLVDGCIEGCKNITDCTHFNWQVDGLVCTLLGDEERPIQQDDAVYEDNASCGILFKNEANTSQ